jgi:hypothetical protein
VPNSAAAFDDAIEVLVKIHAIDALVELKAWSVPLSFRSNLVVPMFESAGKIETGTK